MNSESLPDRRQFYYFVTCLLLVSCAPFLSLVLMESVVLAITVVCVVTGAILIFLWPEAATLIFLFIFYSNVPAVAIRVHDVNFYLAGGVTLMLAFPLTYQLAIKKRPVIINETFKLMILFLIVLILTCINAIDPPTALDFLFIYITEGLILFFLLTNVIRTVPELRRAIWALLLSGAFMGGLTAYSELTGSYENDFAGFVQRGGDFEETQRAGLLEERDILQDVHRSGGPIGPPNRFAQILLVLLPIAFMTYLFESRKSVKLFILASGFLTILGLFLTYSRGASLVLGVIALLLVLIGYIRPSHAALAVLLLLGASVVVAPGYLNRVASIVDVFHLLEEESTAQADGAIRGRATEMLAAFYVFLDYPLFGVAPGHYTPFYAMEYQADPDIAFREIEYGRRAHSLYPELAAETGIFGLVVFVSIPLLLIYRLWQVRKEALTLRPELTDLATGFALALTAYLISGVIQHLSFQRYFWTLVSISAAANYVLRRELDLTEASLERPSSSSVGSAELSGPSSKDTL